MSRLGLPREAWTMARHPGVISAGTVAAAAGMVPPLAVAWIVDTILPARAGWMVAAVAGGLAVSAAVGAVALLGQGFLVNRLALVMAEGRGSAALAALAGASSSQVAMGDAGLLGSDLGQSAEAWRVAARALLLAVAGLASGLTAIFLTGADAAMACAVVVAFLALAGMYWTTSRQVRAVRSLETLRAAAQTEASAQVVEVAGALATLKSLPPAGHDLGFGAFARANRLAALIQEEVARWTLARKAFGFVGSTLALVLLWLDGARSLGELGAAVSAVWIVVSALDSFFGARVSLERYWPVAERVARTASTVQAARGGGRDPGPIRELEARDLWFRYSPTGPWVLRGANVRMAAGEVKHIEWPSGAGKSTLMRLIAGVLHPDQGTILVNGIPLDEVDLPAYRKRLGVLTQEAALISGTILELLRPVLHGTDPEAEAWELLGRVGADGFVRELPLRLHTRLIQGGAGLSGGQTRRILLARALHSGAELALLDEPLAGLGESDAWLDHQLEVRGLMALVLGHEGAGASSGLVGPIQTKTATEP